MIFAVETFLSILLSNLA